MSSNAKDCTKFDDSKVAKIRVGKTTGTEITQWFGAPDGRFLSNGLEVWRYLYVQKKQRTREYDYQVLDVQVDKTDLVKDFKLEARMGLF